MSTRVLARTAFSKSLVKEGGLINVGEQAEVCLAGRQFGDEVYQVVWVGEPSPASERLSVTSVDENFHGEVVLSNGCIFWNPLKS
jgi:hypothetical protein